MITYQNQVKGFRLYHRKQLTGWLQQIIRNHHKKVGTIQYIFCSDAEILHINNTFLKHNYYTDIITFDYSEGNILNAEIYISVETVASNAQLFHVKPKDELYRVMVHGVLHLLGYKDKTKTEQSTMRNTEDKCLEILNIQLSKHNSKRKKFVSRETKTI
jgi:rRNA maturation RNase YbeY